MKTDEKCFVNTAWAYAGCVHKIMSNRQSGKMSPGNGNCPGDSP